MRARAIFGGCVVGTTLVLWTWSAHAQAAPTAPSSLVTSADPLVELVKAVAWPAATLILAALFFKPVSAFLGGIANRITKLSVFKVEFEVSPGATAKSVPLFDVIRDATTAAQISDSTQGLMAQLGSATPADFATVYLGQGGEWITSRLFIAATMIKRMRGVRAIVFLEASPGEPRRFVAVMQIDELLLLMGQRYPWFEAAWGRALSQLEPRAMTVNLWERETSGAFTPNGAQMVVRAFIDLLQKTNEPTEPNEKHSEWMPLEPPTYERASRVTTELLRELLPVEAFRASMDVQLDASGEARGRALLRRRGDFIAVLGRNDEFLSLTDRRAFLEEVASVASEAPK